jgi:hypothetical protein
MLRLIAKTKSISKIRFGIEYSPEVRKGARPVKRFFAYPNNPKFEESLLANARVRGGRIIGAPLHLVLGDWFTAFAA